MEANEIIKRLKKLSNPKNIAGMEKYGIGGKNKLGLNIPVLRNTAKDINRFYSKDPNGKEKRHKLAQQLWKSGIHEIRILSSMVDVPQLVNEKQMESWINDFDSWDLCDQVIGNLFDKTFFAYKKAFEWSRNKKEFVKRAGFVMMATLSVHDKKAADEKLIRFFPIIKREATDERNFVKKAVNWALRQIGKRNPSLRKQSMKVAEEILKANPDSKSAKWIANDAIRELSRK